jgi:NAD(P)-dependent dehydrogenase (short-subunit alcohol dehydrogenase family)
MWRDGNLHKLAVISFMSLSAISQIRIPIVTDTKLRYASTQHADMSGKIVLVTGATSGIGLEACIQLAKLGAHIVMVGRNPVKGAQMQAHVKQQSNSSMVDLLNCDFSSQASIRSLAAEFKSRYTRLDVLINNAGGANPSRSLSVDGIEMTFAVNHLGYFLLTNLLFDVLERSAPSRVVIVASRAHQRGLINFDNLQYEHGGYSIVSAYARSKLCNVLFSNELARRLTGKGIIVNCLHPGVVATNIWSNTPLPWVVQPIMNLYKRFMLRTEQGAATTVYLASSPDVESKSGGYYADCRLTTPSLQAHDESLARTLWEVSERLTSNE